MAASRRLPGALLAALASAAVLAAGCGGGDDQERAPGNPSERAFLAAMVPHHEAAVDMARLARERTDEPYIRRLAGDIVRSQRAEIAQMRRIHRRLFGSELLPDERAHEALGLSAAAAGMDHMDAAARLRNARPFDRAFVDHMVPHHQGAIRMAEAVLARTQDVELRRLAGEIMATQRREIAEMNAFRERRFGGPVPASGGTAGGGGHPAGHSP